jgi:GDP-L-fucose synthase
MSERDFRGARVFVAGHRGMVGSAIVRGLVARGYSDIVTRSRAELDLLDQAAVRGAMAELRPDVIFVAAARVGGINANNTFRAEFIYENLAIATHLIDAAHRAGVQRTIFLGSSCIYPRDCPQPIREEYLLTGPLEPTNEPYAIAKIAALKLCESYSRQYGRQYVTLMPTNIYGPGDNYDPLTSHVLPALIHKAHEAKVSGAPRLRLWGSGRPLREFLHVDDLADACLFALEQDYDGPPLNVGSGQETTIADLARLVLEVVGHQAELELDPSMPDGAPRKLLDSSRIRGLGWAPRISLADGIGATYAAYLRETAGDRVALT